MWKRVAVPLMIGMFVLLVTLKWLVAAKPDICDGDLADWAIVICQDIMQR